MTDNAKRLAEIEDKIVNNISIRDNSSTKTPWWKGCKDDFKWLIARIKELEAENAYLHKIIDFATGGKKLA